LPCRLYISTFAFFGMFMVAVCDKRIVVKPELLDGKVVSVPILKVIVLPGALTSEIFIGDIVLS